MLTDDGKHLYVSWDEYHMLTERLALKVHASGWEFDQILCLARGGMRPGDVLSRVFDKPLAIMSTRSADTCLARSVRLSPAILGTIALDPRLAAQMVAVAVAPEMAAQWLGNHQA